MSEKIKMKYQIEGIPREIEIMEIDINSIDLDPENPRIGYWTDNQVKEQFSQDEIAFALRENSDAVNRLKLSIEANEGIIRDIWVCKKGERFLVIDGNTRLEIYRDLSRKYPNKDTYRKIRCKVLPENIDEKAKNFIRLIAHLRGVNEWEVYERARMLYILWEKKGYSEIELQSSTKLSVNQIRKWISAYKDMTEQFLPQYKWQPDALSKFSYFVEYENPKIKEGMERIDLSVSEFCKWVGEGQIKRAMDVRHLKQILTNKEARQNLANKGYAYAYEQLSYLKPGISSKLFENIEEVIDGLRNMTREEEEDIIEDYEAVGKRETLVELYNEVKKIVDKIEV